MPWYCPECKDFVPPEEVTFEECHEFCGTPCTRGRKESRLASLERENAALKARVEALEKAMPPADRLETLAMWFDVEQAKGRWGGLEGGSSEVQLCLRRWANNIRAALKGEGDD